VIDFKITKNKTGEERMNKLLRVMMMLLVLPIMAFANDYTNQVNAQLYLIKQRALGLGLQQSHADKFSTMNQGGYDSFTVHLMRGTTYRVVAVCDAECPDLDLTLTDENGNQVSKDSSTDSMPIVEATPMWSGLFTIKVSMYRCTNDPCYYGITVLSN